MTNTPCPSKAPPPLSPRLQELAEQLEKVMCDAQYKKIKMH